MKVEWLAVATLIFLSGDILVRRFAWEQVPSQLGPGAVSFLLLINLGWVIFRGSKILRNPR